MSKAMAKLKVAGGVILTLLMISLCGAGDAPAKRKLPDLKPQRTPQAVVDEHLAALNAYDWERLLAQYPEQVEIHLPNGGLVTGRQAVADMFEAMCKPYEAGGFQGAVFTTVHSKQVGNTLMVQWVLKAPFLLEPYKGADAYVTRKGLMVGQVTTFNVAEIKFKKKPLPIERPREDR